MISRHLCLDLEERSFWSRIFYPICLVQEFLTCDPVDIEHFLDESDDFHSHIIKDRVSWLDNHKIKYKMHYDVEYDWNDSHKPIIYRLFIEFGSVAESSAYKMVWS